MDASKHPPLQALSHNLGDMIASVESIDRDLEDVQTLLKDLETTLGYPAKIEGDLKKIQGPLTTIQKIADDMSVLPEIGAAGRAVATTLKPMVKPAPPGGLIGETRGVLRDIDKALAGLKNGLGKIEAPIDDARADLGKILTRLRQFKGGVDYLIRVHGDSPPDGVVRCATALNAIIDDARCKLDEALKLVGDKLATLHDVGATIDGVLQGVGGFIDTIGRLLDQLEHDPFKTLQDGLRTIEKNLAYLTKAGKRLIRMAFRAIGLDLDQMENGLKRFEARIEHFIIGAIEDQLESARDKLLAELQKVSAVQEFEQRLDEFERKVAAMRDEVENELGAECAEVLTRVSA